MGIHGSTWAYTGEHEQGLLSESQCGFWKERGTIDMVFAARQLQEKCQEQNADFYSTFIDLTKGFDTVSGEGLWRIIAKYGCPSKFIAIVRQLHDGMLSRVQDDGETSDPFPITNGVKHVLPATEADMQRSVDKFSDACNNFGLTISRKKTEVMHQPAPGKPYVEPNITINGQRLNAVDKFTYLGSTLSRNVVHTR